MLVDKRIKYYQAEKERLLTCSKYLVEIFASSSSNVDDLETITSILEEMSARVDTWKRLRDGQYKIGRKVQLFSLYGECDADE